MMRVCSILLLFVLLPFGAKADVVHTEDGRRLEGRVIVEGDTVIVEQKLGRVRVSAADVKRIEPGPDGRETLEAKRRELASGTVEERYRFAVYARDHGFTGEAQRAFNAVLALDPNHAEARAALGYVFHDGYWLVASDFYRSQGLVEYRGEWITPTERAARIELTRAEREAQRTAAARAKVDELKAKIAALRAKREAIRERREEVREATLNALHEYSEARGKADAWLDTAPRWGYTPGLNDWWGGYPPGLWPPLTRPPVIRPPLLRPPLRRPPGTWPPGTNPPGWRPPQLWPPAGGQPRPPSAQPLPGFSVPKR